MKILALIANLLVPNPHPPIHFNVVHIDEHSENYVVLRSNKQLISVITAACPRRNWVVNSEILLIREGTKIFAVDAQRYQGTWVMMDHNDEDTMNVLEVTGELCLINPN